MLINKTTSSWVEAYVKRPQAALLVDTSGDKTAGLELINSIHEKLVGLHKPLVIIGKEKKASIGIADIRKLQSSLSLRANKEGKISRIAVINDAETLTVEAQNALLKLIEELPKRTIIALLAGNTKYLLDTISSRCFLITLLPIEEKEALKYAIDKGLDEKVAKRAYALSEGSSSSYIHLLENQDESEDSIDLAKIFFQNTVFARQSTLKKVVTDKENIPIFLNAMRLTAKAGMRHSKSTADKKKWQHNLKIILKTEEQMNSNVPSKLALLSLSVSLA